MKSGKASWKGHLNQPRKIWRFERLLFQLQAKDLGGCLANAEAERPGRSSGK